MSTTGNFILYTRCSTEEQSKKGNSHEYQAEGIRRSGVVRVGRMQEVAALSDTVTGTRFDNRASGLDAAYKLCERQRGTVSYLFVYRWDRLGRDVADCFDCIKRFRAVGVEVNCPDEWIDFSDPSYPLILSVKFGMAQSESMRISDRTRDGVYQAQASGFWTAHAPVGYRKGPARVVNGKERKVCEFDGEKSDIVRRCFEQYADGATKADLFRQYGDALGLRKSQFVRFFHNPFYCGLVYVKAHRGNPAQIVPGQHPPLISRELFDRCQKSQNDTPPALGKSWTQGQSAEGFYLKGVLKCPITGRNMTAYNAKGKSGRRFPYYSSQKIRGGVNIPVGRAHHLIAVALSGLRISPGHYGQIRAEINRQMAERIGAASRESEAARKGLERTRARLSNIAMEFADGNLTADEFRSMKAGFDSDAIRYERQAMEAEAAMQANDDTIERVLELLTGIDTVFAASSSDYKNRILRAVFPDGFFIDAKAGKVRTPCINEIILELCSKSIVCAALEIENGLPEVGQPVRGGCADKYRTHLNALKLLFAA